MSIPNINFIKLFFNFSHNAIKIGGKQNDRPALCLDRDGRRFSRYLYADAFTLVAL